MKRITPLAAMADMSGSGPNASPNHGSSQHRLSTWAHVALLMALTLVFMGQSLFPASGRALGGHDVQGLFYPWFSFARQEVWQGSLPLWDPYHFGGYPFISNPQAGVFYPPAWLAILLPANLGVSWYVALHVCLAGVGMLLFVRRMRGSSLAALLAGMAFCFSGFATARLWAGHIGLLATSAWLPWMLLALDCSVGRGTVRAALFAAVPVALAVLAGHTASLLYLVLVWIGFALFLGLTTGQWRLVVRQAALSGLGGLVLSGVQTVPFIELGLNSARAAASTFEFATDFSFPPSHLITLLIPEYFGEPTRAGYWSVPNFAELTYYAGLLPILGLVLGLRKPSRLTWYYVGLTLLGLLLALGRYGFLYRAAYGLLPLFRLVRAPGRALVLFTFAASALLGEAISVWQRLPAEERCALLRPLMRRSLVLAAVLGFLGLAATGAVFAAQHPTETSGRLWHQLGGWSRALALFLVAGALLWSYLRTGDGGTKLRPVLAAGLLTLTVVDLWGFGLKLVRLEPTAPDPLWTDAQHIIGETDGRVLPWGVSIFAQNGAGQVGLRSIFGYNALEVAATHDLAASVPDPRSTAYDILGTEYVIAPVPLADYTQGDRPLELVGNTASVWVYRRARSLPIARLVYQTEEISDTVTAIARIHAPDLDPAETVILSQPAACTVGPAPDSPGTAHVVEERPGYWLIETESQEPALLVLSETAYPGWRVVVDDTPAEPLMAYTAVRAVCVPAGKHSVEFSYRPPSLQWGAGVTLLAVVALVIAVVRPARLFERWH